MSTQPVSKHHGLFDHPKGLYILFFTEMWERFSYYGMRALLVLYMVKAMPYTKEDAGKIYGWYTGLVYVTPIIGGYLADRYLGARKAILYGGVIMAMGHFIMAWDHMLGFWWALALLIIGNGFFKPNISTTVGSLYEADDPRRDGAFTIFYMGINTGAALAPLVCGTLGEVHGWHYGFGAAGVGMMLGLAVFLGGQRHLQGKGLPPPPRAAGEQRKAEPLTREEWHRIFVIVMLMFFNIFFWSAFEQAGSSMTLFADESTNRMIPLLGIEFKTTWFQAVNPVLIVLLGPFFSAMWVGMAERGREPPTPAKMASGLLLLSLGFVLLSFGSTFLDGPKAKVSLFWLLGAYSLHTVGELCLSPVGLSMVTKLSPVRFASVLMGVWLFSSAAANFVGGMFAAEYETMSKAVFFLIPAGTAGAAGLILLAATPFIRRWMHGVH
ncbi:MAG: Di-/tripeptide transporter [Myxococcota bacterium]|nr:Di-/tripeptide transporter [Myxococcota bacterium]